MSIISYGLSNVDETAPDEVRFSDRGETIYIEILRFGDGEPEYSIVGNIIVSKESFLKITEDIKKNP